MSVFFASTEEEREEIYSLRYKVYIEEFGKKHILHDAVKKVIKDEFDDDCFLLATKNENKVTGSMRTIVLNNLFLLNLTKAYSIPNEFLSEIEPSSISVSDRFIVEKEFRNSRIGIELMTNFYQFGLKKCSVAYCFMNAEKSYVESYSRFGFRVYDSFFTSNSEKRYRMLLLLKDFDYLKEIRSPFTKYFDENDSDNGYSASIAKKYFHFLGEDEV